MSPEALLAEAQAIIDVVERRGGMATPVEASKVEMLLRRAKSLAGARPNVQPLGDAERAFLSSGNHSPAALDMGAVFTASDAYKSIRSSANRPHTWTSGPVDVGGFGTKGTLMEAPGGGATSLVSVPQFIPGIVDKLFQPLTLESLLLAGQATGPTVRYAVEGTATSAAAGVAEGGTKPESTLGFTHTDEPIKKIATVLSISDETLEDAPAIQTFINTRLSGFVRIESERQLFRGAAGGSEVQGILVSRGVPVYAGGTAAGGTTSASAAIQVMKAMNGMRGSAFLEPEWVVMHPVDWEQIRLARDNAGQFFGGGPLGGAYGGAGATGASGQVTGAQDFLWNKPVYVTASIGGAGTALVGTSAGAQVWSRGGLTVEATNSHSTYFVENLTAIRAERRLGLAVYRPSGYVEVRLEHAGV